jgi:hypothetical protein
MVEEQSAFFKTLSIGQKCSLNLDGIKGYADI